MVCGWDIKHFNIVEDTVCGILYRFADRKWKWGNKMEAMNQKKHDRPRLEGCPDYLKFQKVFSESLLDCFEEQLNEYIEMDEVSEDYLRDVPRIVCWFEGMIPTEDLIKELEGC